MNTPPLWRVRRRKLALLAIQAEPGITITRLAKILNESRPTARAVVAVLETEGLVLSRYTIGRGNDGIVRELHPIATPSAEAAADLARHLAPTITPSRADIRSVV